MVEGGELVATSLPAEYLRLETDYIIRTKVLSSGMYCPAARLPESSTANAHSGCDEEMYNIQNAVSAFIDSFSTRPDEPTEALTFAPDVTIQVVTTITLEMSEEALNEMKANPAAAVAGLAK